MNKLDNRYGSRHIVRERVRDIALSRGPGVKLPTKVELCELVGTSSKTMDAVLTDLEASNVVFRRHGSGIYVSPKLHRKNIRVLINASLMDPAGVSPFWGMLWGKIVQEAQERALHKNEDVHIQLAGDADTMDPLPSDMMQAIGSGQLHGVLSIGMVGKTPSWTISSEIPMVSYAGWGYWHVISNNDHAIAGAAIRLGQAGCRKIGLWTNNSLHRNRIDGAAYESTWTEIFQHALRSAGLPYHPELRRLGVLSEAEIPPGDTEMIRLATPASSQEQGYDAVMRTFASPDAMRPDGIVISDDMITSGALIALQRLGIEPGRDIRIASHSNTGSPLLFGWHDRLLLWKVDPGDIVTAMFSLLDRLMAGERPDNPLVSLEPCFAD